MTLPVIPQRNYTNWYITLVIAKSLNPSYFNTTADNVSGSILTLQNSTAPFVAIGLQDMTPDGNGVYKISSNQELDDTLISQIFVGVTNTFRHHWLYTFPILNPLSPGEKYQPIVLADNLLYLNSIESTAVAMGCSVLAGRNLAQIILAN